MKILCTFYILCYYFLYNLFIILFQIMIPYYYSCSFLCSSKEKNEKKRRPEKSFSLRSLRVFRELQNSRASGSFKQLQFFFRKNLTHSELFKGLITINEHVFTVFDTFKKKLDLFIILKSNDTKCTKV